jgi:hypothetical protein
MPKVRIPAPPRATKIVPSTAVRLMGSVLETLAAVSTLVP